MARASIKALRSDIELQSVLRYRRINSRCANGEVHIARLGAGIFHLNYGHINIVALNGGPVNFAKAEALVER